MKRKTGLLLGMLVTNFLVYLFAGGMVLSNRLPMNDMYYVYAQNQDVKYEYDSLGRISTVRYPDGTEIKYGYDANGNLLYSRKSKKQTPPDDGNQTGGSTQESGGGQTGGNTQESGGSQTGGNTQESGGNQTGGNTQESGGSQTGGNTQESGGSQTGGNTQESGGSQTGGNTQESGGSQTGGNTQESGGSQTGGNTQESGGNQTGGNTQESGGSQTGGNTQESGGSQTGGNTQENGGSTENPNNSSGQTQKLPVVSNSQHYTATDVKNYNQFKKKKPVIKSLKKSKSKKKYYLTINIKQVNKRGLYGETGYQIKYATNKKFKKAKTIKLTRNNKSSITSKKWKVKKGKTYYIKVRAMMKTKTGKTIYSKYSKVKSIKVK